MDETLTRLVGEHKVEPIIVVGIDAPDDGPKRASELLAVPDTIGLGLIESPSGSPGNGAIARWTEHWYVTPRRVSIGVGDMESHAFREFVIKLGLDPDANDRAFARISRTVAENLREAGGKDTQVRFVEDPKGEHSEANWARRFAGDVEFLFPVE